MAKPCWNRAYPPQAQSAGCKVTGETQVHRHRHCRCQVCWGGNCQCGRPAASGERETWRENEGQPLVESVRPRGQLDICHCLSDSPLSTYTTLYPPYSFALCLSCPFSLPYLLLFMHSHSSLCFLSLTTRRVSISLLSCSPWIPLRFHWEAAASPQFNPPAGLLHERPTVTCVFIFPVPWQHPDRALDVWTVVSRWWDTLHSGDDAREVLWAAEIESVMDFNKCMCTFSLILLHECVYCFPYQPSACLIWSLRDDGFWRSNSMQ